MMQKPLASMANLALGLWLGLALPGQALPPQQGARFNLMSKGEKVSLKSPPVRNSPLEIYVKALEQPCTLVVFGFSGNGSQPATDFKPRVWNLKPYQADKYEFKASNAQIYIVAAAPGSVPAKQLEAWVSKWTDKRSRTALHDSLSEWVKNQDVTALGRGGTVPPELGGAVPTSAEHAGAPVPQVVKRNSVPHPIVLATPDWMSSSDWVVGDKDRPGVFVYQVEVTSRPTRP
jgi:hypothetical protein